MAKPAATLADIRTAAERLAKAQRDMTVRAKTQEEEIAALVAPVAERHRPGLETAAEERARAHEELMAMVESSPDLFQGKKRSLSVDGVRAGYRKQEDQIDWDDDAQVIARIRALIPDQEAVLVRSVESLVVDAVAQLDALTQRKIGCRRVPGIDQPFVTVGESDVDKLVKTILASIASRVGEEDAPRAKKGKVKVMKEVA
ncbi:MAG: hypothetical protein U0997_06540 [Sulfurimicrobium sp.]|nr:hypothetical protein [Sulfurimicrobium sp.]